MSIQIDTRAVVSPKAAIGDGVQVAPYAVIEDDVTIGEGTSIGAHAVIHSGSRIGKECRIHPLAAIGGFPQDLKFKGEPTTLEIGDRCVVREFVTLNRATAETGRTIIGSNCLFMAYAHVGHDCVVGDNVILANCCALGGHVHLGSWVILGGLTPVHQFCHVGDHAMIGGGFRVVKDVPPYVLAGSEPLIFERLNIVGLRRRGFSEKSIDLLDKTYRLIYRSSLNVSQAVARVKEEVESSPEVEAVLSFISKSKRGIISGYVHH
jgi:UDP-N-acetylglucosamine acyltransferase